jgi:fructose-1,6-bisphosphatase/inositol monophosphatase family enzyme
MNTPVPLQEIHRSVSAILKKTDKLIYKAFQEETTLEWKKGYAFSNAILTKTDKEIDSYLRTSLRKISKEIGFITEEGKQNIKEYNWIIDPIDGTNNFAHNIPIFGTMIALWKGNEPIYSIISFPILRETIHAFSGKGMFYNGKKVLRKSFVKPKPFITFGFIGDTKTKVKVIETVSAICGVPANYRATCFHGAMTALGRMDITMMLNEAIWDIAAPVLIAQEAGLSCVYISKPPDMKQESGKYVYSVVIGEKGIAEKLAKALSPLLLTK